MEYSDVVINRHWKITNPCNSSIYPPLRCTYYQGDIAVGDYLDANDPFFLIDYDITDDDYHGYQAIDLSFNGTIVLENYAKNIKYLGISCFKNCKVKEVVLPNSLIAIGFQAFYGSSIEKIDIGPNVTTISAAAFSFTKKLKILDLNQTKLTTISGEEQPFPNPLWNGFIMGSSIEYIILPDTFISIYNALLASTLRNFTYKKSMNLEYGPQYTVHHIYSERDDVVIIDGCAYLYDEFHNPTILIKVPKTHHNIFNNNITQVRMYAFRYVDNPIIYFKSANIFFENYAIQSNKNITLYGPNLIEDKSIRIYDGSKINKLIITEKPFVSEEIWNNSYITEIYYCKESMLNTTLKIFNESTQLFTLSNYTSEYFLGTTKFTKGFDPRICMYYNHKDETLLFAKSVLFMCFSHLIQPSMINDCIML